MAKAPTIETLLQSGSAQWNKLRKEGKIPSDHTGATFTQLFSANADLSGLQLVGTEWEKCDLAKVNFRDADLSNAYFHGGRLQDCDFRGANLEGATFERLKLLRCDFTGAKGIEDFELDDVDMDRVTGLDGEDAPPPPPPPAVGITSFTREQRAAAQASQGLPAESDLPPFRPQDPPGALVFRALKRLGNPPLWALDVPSLRPPVPTRVPPGTGFETLFREAVKARLEGRSAVPDQAAVERAHAALSQGGKDLPCAAMYLHEVGAALPDSGPAPAMLQAMLQAEVEVDDLTAQVDPRVAGALVALRVAADTADYLGEVRQRLAAAQLFTALLEAGFEPDNNWEEALEASDAAMDLASYATGSDRQTLSEAFRAYFTLPDEARLRRLAYLAEAAMHLEALNALNQEMSEAS